MSYLLPVCLIKVRIGSAASRPTVITPTRQSKTDYERRSNITIFSLPEKKSLADIKSSFGYILLFLPGHPKMVSDAFCLGRRKENKELGSDSVPPRPATC